VNAPYVATFPEFAVLHVSARRPIYETVDRSRKVVELANGSVHVEVDTAWKTRLPYNAELTLTTHLPHDRWRPCRAGVSMARIGFRIFASAKTPASAMRAISSFVRKRKSALTARLARTPEHPVLDDAATRSGSVYREYIYREMSRPFYDIRMTILNGEEIADLLDSIAEDLQP